MNDLPKPNDKMIFNRGESRVRVTIINQVLSPPIPEFQSSDDMQARSWPSPISGPPLYQVKIDEGPEIGKLEIADVTDLEPIS